MNVRRPRANAAIVLFVVLAACSSGSDAQPTGDEQSPEQTSDAAVAGDESDDSGAPEPDASQVSDSSTPSTTSTTIPEVLPLPPAADVTQCLVEQPVWAKLDGPNLQFKTQTGFPYEPAFMSANDQLTIAVLPVDFDGMRGTGRDLELVMGEIRKLEEFFAGVSDGHLAIDVRVWSEWIPLTQPLAAFPQAQFVGPNSTLVQAAVAEVDADFDFADVDVVIIGLPEDARVIDTNGEAVLRTEGFESDGEVAAVASDEGVIPNHLIASEYTRGFSTERWDFYAASILVMMGLPELHGGAFDEAPGWVGGHPDNSPGPFTGWSIMSSHGSYELPAWLRLLLGWMSEDSVYCFEPESIGVQAFDIELAPLGADDGYRALVFPTGETTAIVAEVRRPTGLDEQLGLWNRIGRAGSGVLVYEVDTTRPNRRGTLLPVVAEGREYRNDFGFGAVDVLLEAGEGLRVNGVRIEVLESGQSDRIRVSIDDNAATAGAETVTYVLPSGSFDQPLLDGPTEADEDRCRIPQLPSSHRGGEGYTGFPVTFDNLRPDQNVRIQTIPVDWPDYEGDPDDLAGENEQVQIFMDYYETASQGALSFSPTFADKWYRLPESVSSYPQPFVSDWNTKLAQAGIDAADDDIDFSLVDLVIFFFPNESPILAGTPLSPLEHASIQHFNQADPSDPRWIGSDEGWVRNYIAGGLYFDDPRRPVWSYYVHEAAHTFAMPDWYMEEASARLGSTQDLGLDYSIGPLNVWGVMSTQDGPSRTFVAWTRWLLNWLDDDQVDCYNVDQILDHGAFDTELVALDIYEPGTKAIIVRTGEHSGFLVESRRPVFPDQNLALWETVGRDPYGLIVYEIDTTKGGARGTLDVVTPDGHDELYLETTGRGESFKVDALFNVGDRATVQGIQIELLHSGERDVVRLTPTG